MLAGLSHARGDKVAIMDADLQHPPELLAQMLPLLDGDVQQVVARRTRDDDPRAAHLPLQDLLPADQPPDRRRARGRRR